MSEPTSASTKSFWDKPEGKFGFWTLAVIGGALAATLFFGWAAYVLPLMALALSSVVNMAVSAAILLAIVWAVTDPTIHLYYKVAMYNLAGKIITVDPIGVARLHIRDMKKSLERMEGYLAKLMGKKQGLTEQIKANEENRVIQVKKRDAALARNLTKDARLAAEQAERLSLANKTLSDLDQKVELLHRRLYQMREVADYTIKSTEADVDLKETTWNIVKSANSAMESAMSVYAGNPDERALFERSMNQMTDDISMKVGEMQVWMDKSEKLVNSNNLERDILADDGFKQLAEASSVLLTDEQLKQIVVQTEDRSQVLEQAKPLQRGGDAKYATYLSNDK